MVTGGGGISMIGAAVIGFEWDLLLHCVAFMDSGFEKLTTGLVGISTPTCN